MEPAVIGLKSLLQHAQSIKGLVMYDMLRFENVAVRFSSMSFFVCLKNKINITLETEGNDHPQTNLQCD